MINWTTLKFGTLAHQKTTVKRVKRQAAFRENICHRYISSRAFPGGSEGKVSACNAGDPGSIPGEGRGNPLQCSCLENPMEEEPGGLQSMGSQRIGHNWESQTHMHTHTHTHTHSSHSSFRKLALEIRKGTKEPPSTISFP